LFTQGRKKGVYDTWDECAEYVLGYNGAQFKSFPTYHEAVEFVQYGRKEKGPAIIHTLPPWKRVASPQRKLPTRFMLPGTEHCNDTKALALIPAPCNTVSTQSMYISGLYVDNGTILVGIYLGEMHHKNESLKVAAHQLLGTEPLDQNVADLMALRLALVKYRKDKTMAPDRCTMFSASRYAVDCVHVSTEEYEQRAWKTPDGGDIPHQVLISVTACLLNELNVDVRYMDEHHPSMVGASSLARAAQYK
jgi:hypothetical protein